MESRLLCNYVPERLEEIYDMLDEAYDNLPYPVINSVDNYEKYLKEGKYEKAFKCLIDFFEISMQYVSGFIISVLVHHKVKLDEQLENIMGDIVSKPLAIGDWTRILLVLTEGAYNLLFDHPNINLTDHPVIEKCYAELIKKQNGNFLNGWPGKQGKENRAISTFRNDYIGHDSSLADHLFKEPLLLIEPRLWEMLSMLQPLATYHFFVLDPMSSSNASQGAYTLLIDKGRKALDARVSSDFVVDENAYYVTQKKIRHNGFIKEADVIKISPFVIYYCNEEIKPNEKYAFVFQTLKERDASRMIYVSPNENVRRKETELFRDAFLKLMQTMVGRHLQLNKFQISFKNEKPIAEYQELALKETKDFISQQIASKKYDTDVFLDRTYLSQNFQSFLQGTCSVFVMLGDAGAGKTNQMCYWAETINTSYISLAVNGKNFTNITLEQKLRETFKEGKKKAEAILETLDIVLEKNKAVLCIFFDAINECHTYKNAEPGNGPINLLMEIHTLFVRNNYKNIKVVVSCRSYTWEELLSNLLEQASSYYTVSNQSNDYLVIKGFTPEEFELVYPKYAYKYDLRTSLERISEDHYAFVKMRLYDPLILKTAAQNYSETELPADTRQFNSTKLFEQRFEALAVQEPHGRLQESILNDFTAMLWESFTDSVSIDALQNVYHNQSQASYSFAHKIFKGDTFRYTTAFINLLDEGILKIDKRFNEIRFVYERFNEFLFARHFKKQLSAEPLYRKIPIPTSAYEGVLKRTTHSTVVISALRNALLMDFYEKNDPSAIIKLSQSQLYEAQPLVEDTLSVLMNESYNEVQSILQTMLDFEKNECVSLIKHKTDFEKILTKDKTRGRLSEEAKSKTEEQLKATNDELFKIMKVRQIAVSIIYKIFKSDHIATWLADNKTDPSQLLWIAMADPLPEVRDNASIYIYYIARYNTDLGKRLIYTLSDKVKKTPVYSLISQSARKELQQSYIEPACRVGMFLVIDGLIERKDYKLAADILQIWKDVVRKFTLNHTLIKVVMPFFKFLFARQTVVQTEYVNNGIEYRHFWDVIPEKASSNNWSREGYKLLVPFLDASAKGFSLHKDLILHAYLTGDSFSFFLLERIMIVQGIADWNSVADIAYQLTRLPDTERSKPYIEMSLIYTLFQINHKSASIIPQAEKIFSSLVYSWSLRQKGYYYSHYNHIANNNNPYKQYVLYWYASAYCNRYGDGGFRPGDDTNVPAFRNLIQIAYKQRDKALLYNCLDNMAILVSAAGYYKTALQLFEYLIGFFKRESEIVEFDNVKIKGSLYEKGLRSFICDVLGTVKSYYPKEVDHFIVNKLNASHFPDLDAFREEIFNHALSHEGIGDLLTHKFGNFVIWGILNDEHIRRFFIEICNLGYNAKSYAEWFDYCIRHIFQELFEVKNLEKA